ncbi:hypothetical protein [Actinomadura sp. 3N407]|uniref:hypothetical protein n=1 Tax=Actinomadura sp. 3N407 TaxID=3457423 RepID=UPI003FCE4EA6
MPVSRPWAPRKRRLCAVHGDACPGAPHHQQLAALQGLVAVARGRHTDERAAAAEWSARPCRVMTPRQDAELRRLLDETPRRVAAEENTIREVR